jgi:hypothetical protein
MWRVWRGKVGMGGFLLFDRNGKGGAWYSDNARPAMTDSDVPVACPQNDIEAAQSLERFHEDTRRWIDCRAEDQQRAQLDVEYTAASRRGECWKA